MGTPCTKGRAGEYRCEGIDLKAFIPIDDLGGGGVSDVWGWADPDTGQEYALVGSTRGLLIVDVTRPTQPIYLGNLLLKAESSAIWQDVEVYKDHAFVVCDLSPCGLQVFDLTRLRPAEVAQNWTPDLVFPLPMAHTIDINQETGFLFANGSLLTGGAPVILDVTTPKIPVLVGATIGDGYTHDSLCRVYRGPDPKHRNKEICFNFNEDTITIFDVTDKTSPKQVARVTYPNASYVHSGALTRDHSFLISTDEFDEINHGLRSTLYIWDVRRLAKPRLIGKFVAQSGSVDHNVYTKGNLLFHASYSAGLRVLDPSGAAQGTLKEVAYFDILPRDDGPSFEGAWAAYPYLPSGNVLVTGISQGLFVLAVN